MRKKNAFINVTASMGRGLLYAYLYIMFRPKICYQSRKAKEEIEKGGVIFIGNHVGHNDGQMFYMLFKNSVLIIAKDWADKKILKWLTSGGKFISVDRFGTDITWIRGASEHLRAGDNMIIFPEGHTSKTGVMDEFKPALQCWQLCQVQKLFRYIMTENIISCLGRDLSCMLASRWNLLKRERGLMRSISQVSVRGSGRLWSSSEGSDRTDGAAAGWEACGLRGYGVLKRAPARSRTQRY